MLDSLQRSSDGIVAEIEARIADGRLADASTLPSERVLMEDFGASRTVVREAITALSNRGLLECKPRFRPVIRRAGYETIIEATAPVVRHLLKDEKGVRNLYETRVFVERGLVRDAAVKANKQHIRALKDALEANKNAIADSAEFYRTDMAFHRTLHLVQDNPVFTAIGQGFADWLAPHWDGMERSPERNEENFLAHKAIYDAILERDPDLAEQALIDHLGTAWQHVRSTFNWTQTP